jgi:hypothetical protein
MNHKNIGFAVLILLAIFVTSCSPALAQSNPTPQPVFQPTPVITDAQMNSAISAAKSALAEQLNIDVATIQLVDIQQVQWPDGCLGVQQPGIMCAMHVVDGYRITLSADDQTYEVRSNLDGSQTAIASGQASSSAPVKTKSDGLQITNVTTSIGGENGNPNQQVISYIVTINNPGDTTVTLLWLEPVLQDSLSGRASDANLRNEVNKVLGPNSQVDIQGQLILDTSGLTKPDITQSGTLFSGISISTYQTIPLS